MLNRIKNRNKNMNIRHGIKRHGTKNRMEKSESPGKGQSFPFLAYKFCLNFIC